MADLPIHDRRVLQPQTPNTAANIPGPYLHPFHPYTNAFYHQYQNYGLQNYAPPPPGLPPPGFPPLAHPQLRVVQHYMPCVMQNYMPSDAPQNPRYTDENVQPAQPATQTMKQHPNVEPRPGGKYLYLHYSASS